MVEQNNDGWGDEDMLVGGQVELDVCPNADINEENDEADICVRITPPKDLDVRIPIDLCCCVDISASMRAAATYED